jgi:hypothetical protein
VIDSSLAVLPLNKAYHQYGRPTSGTLQSRSFQDRHGIRTYLPESNSVLYGVGPGVLSDFIEPYAIVSARSLIREARRNRQDTVSYGGTVTRDGERLSVVNLRVVRRDVGLGTATMGYGTERLFLVPGTYRLKVMDFGSLPAESCRQDAPQSRIACYRYASRDRPYGRTTWLFNRKVATERVPRGIFRLNAPLSAKRYRPDAAAPTPVGW